jgi:hypothetical protein
MSSLLANRRSSRALADRETNLTLDVEGPAVDLLLRRAKSGNDVSTRTRSAQGFRSFRSSTLDSNCDHDCSHFLRSARKSAGPPKGGERPQGCADLALHYRARRFGLARLAYAHTSTAIRAANAVAPEIRRASPGVRENELERLPVQR